MTTHRQDCTLITVVKEAKGSPGCRGFSKYMFVKKNLDCIKDGEIYNSKNLKSKCD